METAQLLYERQADRPGHAQPELNFGLDTQPAAHGTNASRITPVNGWSKALYDTRFEPALGIFWAMLRPDAPVSFTPELLDALHAGQADVKSRTQRDLANGARERIRYQVFGSRIPGVFSLGGDLALFRALIRERDSDALLRYATACIDVVHTNAVNYGLPVTTISLVQGRALGGGFEAALAANVVIAERGCRMGLPEILFNMFPGMGAFQFLSKRVTPLQAERIITSGRTYTSEELFDMGVIDVLAEPGEGEAAVRRYIKGVHRQAHGRAALRRAVHSAAPLDYDVLVRVAGIWVECAMGLSSKDLETIDYLVRAQQRLRTQGDAGDADYALALDS